MASEMVSEKGDDCIVVKELDEENCVEDKSACVISITDSSDDTEKMTLSSKSSENKVMCDDVGSKSGTSLQPTEMANVNSSGHLQNTSKLCS